MSWHDPDQEDTTIYKVVVNHEEQYSIWPEYKENPLGWTDAGKTGLKAECLAHIKEVWTDMRPLSLRKKMEEIGQDREHNPGRHTHRKPNTGPALREIERAPAQARERHQGQDGDHPQQAFGELGDCNALGRLDRQPQQIQLPSKDEQRNRYV